jgi:hypothetical protein
MITLQFQVENLLLDMRHGYVQFVLKILSRICVPMSSWAHEGCIGLSRNDTEVLVCPDCGLKLILWTPVICYSTYYGPAVCLHFTDCRLVSSDRFFYTLGDS